MMLQITTFFFFPPQVRIWDNKNYFGGLGSNQLQMDLSDLFKVQTEPCSTIK